MLAPPRQFPAASPFSRRCTRNCRRHGRYPTRAEPTVPGFAPYMQLQGLPLLSSGGGCSSGLPLARIPHAGGQTPGSAGREVLLGCRAGCLHNQYGCIATALPGKAPDLACPVAGGRSPVCGRTPSRDGSVAQTNSVPVTGTGEGDGCRGGYPEVSV